MMALQIGKRQDEPLSVLCLGSHSDDIEIGCGGTLLRLKQQYRCVNFRWVVFSAHGVRAEEAAHAAGLFTYSASRRIDLESFPDGFLPYHGAQVKAFFESLKKQVNPDLIFTHYGCDAHQDHRLLSELTWNTFRNHWILEYEIPKYDGDLGRPNFFVPLEEAIYQEKLDHLFTAFRSQQERSWFQRETFLGLMRLRGMECNAPSGYAEAFHCRKAVL